MKKTTRLLSIVLAVTLMLTMSLTGWQAGQITAMAAPLDATRYKDVTLNIDTKTLVALGLDSADDLTDALKQYLIPQGISSEKIQVRGNETQIDVTDLSQWFVYDHYDTNYWNNSANWGQYGEADTQADAWFNLYGRTPTDIMRPQFLYNDPYTDSVPRYHGELATATWNFTLEQIVTNSATNAELTNNLAGSRNNKRLREHIYSYEDPDTGRAGMWFSGYGVPAYTDFLFYPTTSLGTKNVKFTVDSQYVFTHSMSGAGFLVNTGIYRPEGQSQDVYNASDTRIKGYIVYFVFPTNQSGSNVRPTSIQLLPIDTLVNNLHDTSWSVGASLASATFATTGEWFPQMDIELIITETGIQVFVEPSDGIPGVSDTTANAKLSYQESTPGSFSTGYQGFGPLVNYVSHACSDGTAFKLCDLEMSSTTDAFESILTGSNSDYRQGNDVDRFYVNLVSTPVKDSSPDFWDGIDTLRGSKTFYITQNTDNTVVENKPGGHTTPEPHNLINGMSGYFNGTQDVTGWPKSDGMGYWDPANIPSGSQEQALQDLVKWLGDYITTTTTADWVAPTSQSQNPKPIVDAEFIGTPVDDTGTPTGSPMPLSGLNAQHFATDPIKVSIKNNFDNTASGKTIKELEISWVYQAPGAVAPVDMSSIIWPYTKVAQETIDIDPNDPGGTPYDLQNFTFEPSIIPDVSSWPSGEYIAKIIAVGSDGKRSIPVYKAITLQAVYSIDLDISATIVFPAQTIGYSTAPSQTVTVTNTGNQDLGALSVELSGAHPGSFVVSDNTVGGGIAVFGSETFKIAPNTGLATGTYTATVTVSGSNTAPQSFDVSFTVNDHDTYVLSVSATTGGSIASSSTASGNYAEGYAVSITAEADAGYLFTGWTASGVTLSDPSSSVASFAMPATAVDLIATFEKDETGKTVATDVLVVKSSNPKHGTILGVGTYKLGDSATLTAIPNKGYYFKGWAEGDNIVSTDSTYSFTVSKESSLTAVFAKIGKPSVKATSKGTTSIKLTWKKVDGANTYEVYKKAPGQKKYKKIKTTTKTSFVSKKLATGKTYSYKVRVKCKAGNTTTYGSYSKVKKAKPIPATPTNVKSKQTAPNTLLISWKKVPGATGYECWRITPSTGKYNILRTTKSTTFLNTRLTKDNTYYYKVRAYKIVGDKKVFGKFSKVMKAAVT